MLSPYRQPAPHVPVPPKPFKMPLWLDRYLRTSVPNVIGFTIGTFIGAWCTFGLLEAFKRALTMFCVLGTANLIVILIIGMKERKKS